MKYKNQETFNEINKFGEGLYNSMYAEYFSSDSYLNLLTKPGEDPLIIFNVTFSPSCHNNWHTHKAENGGGQVLICTAGEGWYQEEGKEAISLKEGSVITIPANTKHWHGAKKDSWFAHIAIEIPGKNVVNEWHEPVTDEEYANLERDLS
jgi:quercetin dioxygenase-like cupin family protein